MVIMFVSVDVMLYFSIFNVSCIAFREELCVVLLAKLLES